jgi:hypothetical protein
MADEFAQKKSRSKAAFLMIADQAAINTGFDFRRYAMKPTPAKPRIIMAHMVGSGTPLMVNVSSVATMRFKSERSFAFL